MFNGEFNSIESIGSPAPRNLGLAMRRMAALRQPRTMECTWLACLNCSKTPGILLFTLLPFRLHFFLSSFVIFYLSLLSPWRSANKLPQRRSSLLTREALDAKRFPGQCRNAPNVPLDLSLLESMLGSYRAWTS